MGWLDSILSPPSRRTASGAYDIWNDDAAWTVIRGASNVIGGRMTAAGVTVDYNTALNCAAALACTRAIAETLATLPALVFQSMPDETRRKARENPIWRLLHDKPNPDMDSVTYYGMQTKRLVNRGNAYSLIEYNERQEPIALWPVHNSRVRAWREPYKLLNNGRRAGGELYYHIYADDPKDDVDVDPRYMLNVVGFDSEDGVTACGVVPRAKEEISLDTAAQQFSGTVYGNGAMPLGLVKHPSFIQDEKVRDVFRQDINSLHRGRENWNKVGILWQGATWEKLGFSPEEVQSLAGRVLTAKIICQYYGVPPGIIQIFDDYKFATVEAMLKHFIMLCIRPYAVRWEKAVGTQVLSGLDDNIFLEFALEGLLRGDPLAQAQANSLMRQWGVLSTNEWRGQFNWNPVDGGDKLIVPMNYTTLQKVGSQEALIPGAKSAAPDTREQPAHFDPQALSAAAANLRIAGVTRGSKRRKNAGRQKRDFALQVLADSVNRMASKERSAVLRAVKQTGNFVSWLDEYHEKFSDTMADAVVVGVRGYDAKTPVATAGKLATRYVQASREAILAACECQPDELESRVTAAVESWPPIQITEELMKGLSNAA